MKTILIFINDSLGELDWISPFIISNEAKEFKFYVYLNLYNKKYKEKLAIFNNYKLNKNNIILLNDDNRIDYYSMKLDNFLNRILGIINKYSFRSFKLVRYIMDTLRKIVGSFYNKTKKVKFDYIFRDYNLKDTFILNSYIQHNSKAKIIIFPHAIGLQKINSDFKREPLKQVKSHLWLENSHLSDIPQKNKFYQNIFYNSGSPSISINYDKQTLFNPNSKNILVITRDCGNVYGFSYEDAFKTFDILLAKLETKQLNIFIKHHPRDKKLNNWRKIQNKYENIYEFETSLNNIEIELKACLTLFSTAALFLLSRGIPVFEISPYKKYKEYQSKMPFHFEGDDGYLTHDLLHLNLFKKLKNINLLEKETLVEIAQMQVKQCKTVFPVNANRNIVNKLRQL